MGIKKFYNDPLIPPLLWVSIEFLRSFIFPTPLAISQYRNIYLIQIASITGIYGISFLIIFANSLISSIFLKYKIRIRHILILCFFLLIIIGTNVKKSSYNSKSKNIAVVQGGIPAWYYFLEEKGSVELERWKIYFELTKGIANAELIIWPESTFEGRITGTAKLDSIKEMAKNKQTEILINASSYNYSNFLDLVEGNIFNTTFLIDKEGTIVGSHKKRSTVPILESHLKKGKEDIKIIEGEIGQFGSLICFESLFSGISRNMTEKGAEFLVIMSNDGGLQKSPTTFLHFTSDVFRAVENRRFLVRAGQTGISAIITPTGKITKKIELSSQGILRGEISLLKSKTFYTKFGDLFGWFILFFTAILLIFKIKNKN